MIAQCWRMIGSVPPGNGNAMMLAAYLFHHLHSLLRTLRVFKLNEEAEGGLANGHGQWLNRPLDKLIAAAAASE